MAMVCMVNATALALAKRESMGNVTTMVSVDDDGAVGGCSGNTGSEVAVDYGVWCRSRGSPGPDLCPVLALG